MNTYIKNILQLFILLLICLNARSQENFLSIGPKVGANFSTLNTSSFDASINASEESITGLTGGAFLEIGSNSSLSLQVELLYSEQGTSLDSSVDELKDIELDYLQAPILLKYRFLKLFNIHAGPQLGFLTNDIKSDTYKTEDFDFSGVTGVGVEFGKLRADLRYHFGFSEAITIDLPTDTTDAENRYFSLTLGYELF